MRTYFFDPKDRISLIAFSATVEIACETSKTPQSAEIWILPLFVKDALAKALDSCMCAKNRFALLAASMQNEKRLSYKLLCLYPEV